VIADEGWFVDYYLHEDPRQKRFAYAWLADFIGVTAVPEDDETQIAHGLEWNRQMVEHVDGRPDVRDLSLFVGEEPDIVDLPLAPELPSQRAWAAARFGFPGYIAGDDLPKRSAREQVREELGWGDEPVCIAAVGGSGVGQALLERAVAALPALRERLPGARMVAVAGPRIDPARIPGGEGVKVAGFVEDLPRLLAAADVAVVQGGLTTAMELTAAGRPFVYVPLEEHFEQQVHVHHRLRRYGAGQRLHFADAEPEALASALASAHAGGGEGTATVQPGGARRAAERLVELL